LEQQSVQVAGSSRLRAAPPARIAQAVRKGEAPPPQQTARLHDGRLRNKKPLFRVKLIWMPRPRDNPRSCCEWSIANSGAVIGKVRIRIRLGENRSLGFLRLAEEEPVPASLREPCGAPIQCFSADAGADRKRRTARSMSRRVPRQKTHSEGALSSLAFLRLSVGRKSRQASEQKELI
jgi:hypothetical protein